MGPKGAITALYTVLVEGDDTNDPIADATRGILDGHLVLSRRLTSRGHYPPIDVLNSLSRTMPFVVPQEQMFKANEFREMMAAYTDVEDLVSIGAYKRGSKPLSDKAIDCQEAINRFLRQGKAESATLDEALNGVVQAISPDSTS